MSRGGEARSEGLRRSRGREGRSNRGMDGGNEGGGEGGRAQKA